MKKTVSKIVNTLICILVVLGLFVDTVGKSAFEWYKGTFGVTIEEILYTVKSPLKGANTEFLKGMIPWIGVSAVTFAVALFLLRVIALVDKRLKVDFVYERTIRVPLLTVVKYTFFAISIFYAIMVVREIDGVLKIADYFRSIKSETHIYEDYYVKPDISSIVSTKQTNLIHIYMESMETTYASADVGGHQPVNNYIPHLTQMASDNISFSSNENLGGFVSTHGTGWTIVAMFAAESGIPFRFPIDENSDFGNRESFANGTVALGDILKQKGYNQEFLCGSDASFGGRRTFYTQHGNFEIYDVYNALEDGYIDEPNSWWGVDDKDLYKIAKDELGKLASQDMPFNLTMLTVDTHHVDGWVCDLCGDEYPDHLANVVKCADDQIFEFVNWCKEQEWYEDTVIVIQGDHPRMDTSLVGGVDHEDRTIYNCFLNTKRDKGSLHLKNRKFTPMDMYPTILSSMGYDIPGNKLGLGTDMFSNQETLSELLGLDYVDTETSRYSLYYIDTFS